VRGILHAEFYIRRTKKKKKKGQKRLFLPKPPFPGAGVSQSATQVEQLLVFLEFVEWS
jgi:hypothetical protein